MVILKWFLILNLYMGLAMANDKQIKSLLDIIGKAESDSVGSYNAVYGSKTGIKGLTNKTIKEVFNEQSKRKNTAIGRYQFIKPTLKGLVKKLKINENEIFSPKLQDRLAIELMREKGLKKYLNKKIKPSEFGNNLSRVWAGLPVLTEGYKGKKRGQSYYSGVGTNKAIISPEMLEKILNNEEFMKKEKSNKSIMGPLQSLQLKNEEPKMSMELMSLEKIPTQQVDEVVNRSPASKQVPEETINKVKDELKVPGEQDRIQNNAKTGQNKQPMDQLKEAFMYFGPQILTSILVGPEAGAKTGELLKGYRQDLLKQQQLAEKEGITPYQRESLDRQDKRIKLERDKMKDIQKRSDKRFGYRQEENIAKQMGKEAAFDRGMHQLNRMEKILSKNPAGFTGKIDAIKQKAAQEIGGEDPNFTAFQQAVTDFGSQYIKEISGAQVSDAERKRLDEALPSVWAQESVNVSRIKGIKNLMLAIKDRNDRIKARLGGAVPKGMKLKDFFKPGDELDVDGILKGKSKKQTSEPKVKPIEDLVKEYLNK